MSDLPEGIRERLLLELSTAREAARERDLDRLEESLSTVRSICDSLAADDLVDRLRYGCERVEALAADEPLVAAEYLRSMHELVTREW